MRIGSLWIKDKEGHKTIGGELESDVGINLPAGSKLQCRLVRNEKKQKGDHYPDYYLEAWIPREGQTPKRVADSSSASSMDEDIPF